MFAAGDALGAVDRQGVTEAKEQSLGLGIKEAAPFDVADAALLVAQSQAAFRPADDFDDIAVVADCAALAVDDGRGLPEQPHPITGG